MMHPGSAAPQRGLATNRHDARSYAYGWHSRGYLPHFDAPHAIQHITYRLADSLPSEALERINKELAAFPADRRDIERRRRIEEFMDAGYGSCVLVRPEAARCIIETWFRFDAERYRLLAFVVMPNHCHVLIQCIDACPLWKIVNSWKSYTGRWINAHILKDEGRAGARRTQGRSQALWQRDYWDRYIRDENHFQAVKTYIENNPVSAGLTKSLRAWPWSSAADDVGDKEP